jgi:hypothetical protein
MWVAPVLAQEDDLPAIGVDFQSHSLNIIGIALLILFGLSIMAVLWRKPAELVKRAIFGFMILDIIGVSIAIVYMTISVNFYSWSRGPVHWHSDYQVWACGQQLDLVNPKGLSNKVGTRALHEHNDGRIHYEGVVVTPADATLGHFFEVVGGQISKSTLIFPTNDSVKTYRNGDLCGTPIPAQVQTFIFSVNSDNAYSQRKSLNPDAHTLSPHTQVPPGECIIIEFDTPKSRTNHLCRSFEVAVKNGKLKGESK